MIIRKKRTEFALCIADQAYEDLNDWKVYRVLADEKLPGSAASVSKMSRERIIFIPRIGLWPWIFPKMLGRGYRDGGRGKNLTERFQ
jgi:hypothetical protein